jgi:hypothetical protein
MRSLVELFKKSEEFDHVRLLKGLYDDYGKRKEETTRILDDNLREIHEFIKNTNLNEVCVSLDDRDVDQAAAYYAVKYNQDVTCSILEDGMGAYWDYSSNWSPHKHPLLHAIRQRVVHGFRYQRNIEAYGDSKYISKIYTIFPTLLSSKYREFIKSSIPSSPILNLRNSEKYTEYLETAGLNVKEVGNLDILLLLPKIDSQSENSEQALLSELVSKLNNAGLTVGTKCHPRQEKTDNSISGTIAIPQSIPAELVLVHPRTDIQAVIGGSSTVYLSSNWLLEGIDSISIRELLPNLYTSSRGNDELNQIMKSLGVIFPNTISEVVEATI